MFRCCGHTELNQTNEYRELPMDDRVMGHLNDYRIRTIDYCCNGIVTVVGVALIVFAAWLILVTQSPHWVTLTLSGGTAFFGGVLTILSIKWMIESCQKSNQYDQWVNESEQL